LKFNLSYMNQIFRLAGEIMTRKIFLLLTLLCALVSSAFSQTETAKDSMMSKEVSAADAAKSALNVGAKMPAFTLKDSNGKLVDSKNLLKQGNLVVVFYRGAWCPFCNLYLKKLQGNISQIKAQNANLVAISVENPDRSLSLSQKHKVEFPVLSDPNLETARKFGIVYQLPKETNEKYIANGLDLAKYNSTEKAELPLSATYIVTRKGKIIYAFLEPDYTKRVEPSVIIKTLSKIKK